MNRRIVLVAHLDRRWADLMRALQSDGVEIDVLGPATSAVDVVARATGAEAVVVVEIQSDPASSVAVIAACARAAGPTPVVAVTTDPSLELTRAIRLSGAYSIVPQPETVDEIRSAIDGAFASIQRIRAARGLRRQRRILVIDDDADFVASTAALLGAQGYTVDAATNGRDGLRLVRGERPDLIVLDVMMEHDSEGYEVTQAIKFGPGFEHLRSVPILMVSSIAEDPATRFSRAEAVDMVTPAAYLTKPLDIPAFLNEVRILLGEYIDSPARLTM